MSGLRGSRGMRLRGLYVKDLEPALESRAKSGGIGRSPTGKSMAQAGVKGMRGGRFYVKQGGTAGFSVPLGRRIRLFAL